MNSDTFLSLVVDDMLVNAGKRQHEAACAATVRYFLPPDVSIVGMERYGMVDFVIRILRHMRLVHGVKWTHRHDKFVINDFACVVNAQGLVPQMREAANGMRFVQLPYKRCKMAEVISGKFAQFEKKMDQAIPHHKRYFKLSLIGMYAFYVGRQMQNKDYYEQTLNAVTGYKRSFFPSVARRVGLESLSEMMELSSTLVMNRFDEASTRFRSF